VWISGEIFRIPWTKQNGKAQLEVVVPPNTTATLEFPDARPPQELAPGTHRFADIPL
jgi:alpha-L-rhamnosidase